MTYPNDGTNQLFVVQQSGQIMVFPNESTATTATTFLDISDRTNNDAVEAGLLGLAFDPDYKNNGYFYVYYTTLGPRRGVLSRFSVDEQNPDLADLDSEHIVLTIQQPEGKIQHNSGQIRFGPDGYLYVSVGESGQSIAAQNTASLLGKILRIDVSTVDSEGEYSIPPDNPFVEGEGEARPEIWAYGLRNPWRFSFDNVTGKLWVTDVGAENFEEVNIIERGHNYGWNIMEGFQCFQREEIPLGGVVTASCDKDGLELPIVVQQQPNARSLAGGYVYRGTRLPFLKGIFIYGDFGTGTMWALQYDGKEVVEHVKVFDNPARNVHMSSFGVDQSGELYILSYVDGRIYRLKSTIDPM